MTLYTPKQAAEEIGVSLRTLARWRSNGTFIPFSKTVSGHSRYSQEQIDSLKPKPAPKAEERYDMLEELMG